MDSFTGYATIMFYFHGYVHFLSYFFSSLFETKFSFHSSFVLVAVEIVKVPRTF